MAISWYGMYAARRLARDLHECLVGGCLMGNDEWLSGRLGGCTD